MDAECGTGSRAEEDECGEGRSTEEGGPGAAQLHNSQHFRPVVVPANRPATCAAHLLTTTNPGLEVPLPTMM